MVDVPRRASSNSTSNNRAGSKSSANVAMSRKPALLKPKPSRGSKETRAFDRVEPRIADIDRVFHRGLQPVRGGFQTTPARIHSSILESSVRRASSQRRLRVRGGAWESHSGSLGAFSGFGSLSFSSRETVRANSHETSPKMPHALATGNISKRLDAGSQRLPRSLTARFGFC